MTTISISHARETLPELGNRAAYGGERFMIERRGKGLCALVPVEDLELLERLEDAMDIKIAEERRDEPTVTLAELKKELGF
ncbi:MAG: prevent-host-death family protein [Phycisphaerales bacterium]|jgi:PHD/YefM family antitoxin component YafN of YafNO toxin-antitoxin module|nr:prevent-host-death family protein [Phycisphaerales bacterium]